MSEAIQTPHEYDRFTLVEVEIAVRPEYNGRAAKPECVALNGEKMILEVMWQQDAGDKYPGEFALGDSYRMGERYRLFNRTGISWISSGDVKFIREVPRSEVLPNVPVDVS